MTLSEQDKKWLAENYPGLELKDGNISGTMVFRASYNDQTQIFNIIRDPIIGDTKYLDVSFSIRITERDDKSLSRLPAVYVEGATEHISRDKTTCLCSPLEEDEFLEPEFRLQDFLDKLVAPFLYGQVFFRQEKRWPWQDYGHGAVGLFESYLKIQDPSKVKNCLDKLRMDR
jgi:hypothetical protein